MEFEITTKKTVETRHYLELDRPKLLAILRQCGHEVPDNAGIFVKVPGGGDWSNEQLDIDDAPIQIYFSNTVES